MKNKPQKKKVLLGLSGGVDSAVAALLLKKQGYEVIGAFMRNFSENKNQLTGECNWVEDKKEAQKIAALLGIKFITLNFEEEYKKSVINPMFKSYGAGITPNPDYLCNKEIKFPLLWKEAKKLGADYIATGHYIIKKKTPQGFVLKIPKDKSKDQSYFLFALNQKDLEHSLFPIGEYTKEEVRSIAKKHNFPNFDRKGSKGICFVGKLDMKSFLMQKIKNKPGKILSESGEVVGSHEGISYFTIGERLGDKYGTKISDAYRKKANGKVYVAGKDKKKNLFVVAPENHPSLLTKEFFVKKLNWLGGKQPEKSSLASLKVRIRHLGELMPAKLTRKGNNYLCLLKKPVKAIAPGQSAVFYRSNVVLGGGEIYR